MRAKVVSVQKGAQADEGVLLRVGLRARRGAVVPCALSECEGQCVGQRGARVGGYAGWLWWVAVVGGCGRLRIHVQKEHRREQRHVAGRCGAASARVGVDGDEELVQRGLHG